MKHLNKTLKYFEKIAFGKKCCRRKMDRLKRIDESYFQQRKPLSKGKFILYMIA